MSNHDSYHIEVQLHTLMHRGQWAQALAVVDGWLGREPARVDLLLHRAQVLRALHRYEQALLAVREYQTRKKDDDVAFFEIELLLGLGRADEGLRLLQGLPLSLRDSARGQHSLGHIHMALRDIPAALQAFWGAFQQEPSFHRALVEWATAAVQVSGKWWVRRQLEQLLAHAAGNQAVAVGAGLALAAIDPRYGRTVLRRVMERYPQYVSSAGSASRDFVDAPTQPAGGTPRDAQEAYQMISEHIAAGRYPQALATHRQVTHQQAAWAPVLAPLVAEMLLTEVDQPEEARRVLEEALRHEPTDYRLHISYTRIFLRLGFGEEALSSADCALVLAPESERAIVLVQRAGAHLLLQDTDRALADLTGAVARQPEVREIIQADPLLRPLARHTRYRALVAGEQHSTDLWGRIRAWLWGK